MIRKRLNKLESGNLKRKYLENAKMKSLENALTLSSTDMFNYSDFKDKVDTMTTPFSIPALVGWIFFVQMTAFFISVTNDLFVQKRDDFFSESPTYENYTFRSRSIDAH